MFRSKRLLAGATAAALVCAGLASSAGARTDPVRDSGTSWFSVTHIVNGVDHAAGQASDKVFGNVAITYLLKTVPTTTTGTLAIESPSVTLYTTKGSLSGTATATLTVAPTGDTITNGKLKLTKGTGALKGDKLSATFSGTGNTTTNQYEFTYQGELSRP